MKDVFHNQRSEIALKAQVIASDTTTVGETIDMKGADGALFQPFTGTLTDGDYELQLFVGNASNMSDEVEVAHNSADILGTMPDWEADTDDDKVSEFCYIAASALPGYRYARLKVVSTNFSSVGAVVGALVSLMFPSHAPMDIAQTP